MGEAPSGINKRLKRNEECRLISENNSQLSLIQANLVIFAVIELKCVLNYKR